MSSRTGPGPAPVSAWLTPLLMVYYLCCWPHEDHSDTSSERRGGRRATLGHYYEGAGGARELGGRRVTSAVSLHLPGTSGTKDALSAHRSHEEIRRRRSQHEQHEARYHSAPSVIDEVLHRRDWERSTRELHIPLRPEGEALSASSGSPEAPRAEPESSSLEDHRSDEQIVGRPCKKHHSNIKSSKGKKERQAEDDKDCDATETSFYIGDNDASAAARALVPSSFPSTHEEPREHQGLCPALELRGLRAKEAKQSFNESIRCKERPRQSLMPLDEHTPRMFSFWLDDVLEQLESLDRSGATHGELEPGASLPYPPASVEAVGYEGGAVYLAERERSAPRPRAPPPPSFRARHASDGDILAPPHRPESGAFSESDLDLECEDEPPPPYEQLRRPSSPSARDQLRPQGVAHPPASAGSMPAHGHIETAI